MSELVSNEGELERQLLSTEMRFAAWQQLAKDMSLSGTRGFPEHVPDTLPEMMKVAAAFIESVKSNNMVSFNIKYHIDLPMMTEFQSLSNEELAKLMIYRALQKVWLRKQLSDYQSK